MAELGPAQLQLVPFADKISYELSLSVLLTPACTAISQLYSNHTEHLCSLLQDIQQSAALFRRFLDLQDNFVDASKYQVN